MASSFALSQLDPPVSAPCGMRVASCVPWGVEMTRCAMLNTTHSPRPPTGRLATSRPRPGIPPHGKDPRATPKPESAVVPVCVVSIRDRYRARSGDLGRVVDLGELREVVGAL